MRAPSEPTDTPLVLGPHSFSSRLFVGTGKYATFEAMEQALALSGTQCVTVAVRRVNLDPTKGASLLDHVDRERYTILPNTAGCFDAASAVRTARLAREILDTELVKLEVLGDERTLLPDPVGTLEATRELVADGFRVLVYTSDDPRLAVRLEEAGAAAIMPAGSPIGSGQGVLNPNAIRIILELVKTPVIVDAGVGTASDVALAMELGVEGVLLNSGIALAREPLRMAAAMRDACIAGRNAFLAGRIPRRLYANASSPVEGRITPAPPKPGGAQPSTKVGQPRVSSFAAGLVLASSVVAVAPLAAQVLRALVPRGQVFFARWGFSHAFVVLASGFLALVLTPAPYWAGEFLGGLYRTMAGLGTAAVVAGLYARRLHPEGVAALGFRRAGNARAILAGSLAYVIVLPCVLGMAFVWPTIAGWLEVEVESQAVLLGIQALAEDPAALTQAMILALIVGPLVEETVFRGFLQPLLVQNLHERGGIAATSFVFAALHGAAAFLPLFALSVLLGAIQLRSQRLAAAWFVHGLHNALTLTVALGTPEWFESVSIETS